MLNLKELDKRNTYNPNLQNIKESAERTFGEANIFFEMIEKYLTHIQPIISALSEKQVYDISNAIASELAKCCELYLKALFIYENNIVGNNIDEIWRQLKNPGFKLDSNGNPIYLLEKENGIKIYIYASKDENGQIVYKDKQNNIYPKGQQGKKIKISGHQLDGLIDKLSTDTRLLLEMRMLNIPMPYTEIYDKVSIYDELKKGGIIFGKSQMAKTQYMSWIDQHKKTFEETRYAGQKKHDINLEFLYHLTKQIKAVAQYKITPNKNQISSTDMAEQTNNYNDVNQILKICTKLAEELWGIIKVENDYNQDDSSINFLEELQKLPDEIQKKLGLFDIKLLSKELFDLITCDESAREKFLYLMNNNDFILKEIYSKTLCGLLTLFDKEEFFYILNICELITNNTLYNFHKFGSYNNDIMDIKKIVQSFRIINFSINEVISYSIYLKKKFNCKIDNNVFIMFVDFMQLTEYLYSLIDKEIINENLNSLV